MTAEGRRYAVALFGRRVTAWRTSRDDAVFDAIRKRLASRDDWPGGKVYTSIGVKIICG